jgi:hypothetical protein
LRKLTAEAEKGVPMEGCKKDFEKKCNDLRECVKALAEDTRDLMTFPDFTDDSLEGYPGQYGEMKANIMLAYRHMEDARMRVGKILQAAGDGVSILDKENG